MEHQLQELIDRGMTFCEIVLPIGEFEGPIYVRKPCTIVGNVTTLWSRRGPAFIVESTGVTVHHLRVEVLEAKPGEADYISVITKQRDTSFQHVEVIGDVQGVSGEDGTWKLPKLLSLGEFSAKGAQFLMEIEIPVAADVCTSISALTISPQHLEAGRNQVILTLDQCKPGTFFYGEIAVVSQFIHKIYLNGLASEAVGEQPGAIVVYTPEQGQMEGAILSQGLMLSHSTSPRPVEVVPDVGLTLHAQKSTEPLAVMEPPGAETSLLQRGQRMALPQALLQDMKLVLTYTERNEPVDLDPYVFLLDGQNMAHRDEDLIFFGNPQSPCGGVVYQEEGVKKIIRMQLEKLPTAVERVGLCYAIYGDRVENNFSKLKEAAVQLFSGQKELLRLPLNDLNVERTVVAIEFYRYKGQWKLNAIGSGYRDGLKRLCESYGLEIADA